MNARREGREVDRELGRRGMETWKVEDFVLDLAIVPRLGAFFFWHCLFASCVFCFFFPHKSAMALKLHCLMD